MPFSIGFILLAVLVTFVWWWHIKGRESQRDSLVVKQMKNTAHYRDRGRR